MGSKLTEKSPKIMRSWLIIFNLTASIGIFNKLYNCPIKLCWAFFRNCRHARRNIWQHSTVFTEQEKCCARSKSELFIKTSKSCDLNFANSGRDREAKTSPRHLNFWKQLNKTTEQCYLWISGFKIQQGTQCVPRNTVTEQIYHITIRNVGIAYRPSFLCLPCEASEGIMFSGCPSVRLSVFPSDHVCRHLFVLRQHGPTDWIHNLYKHSTPPTKVFYQRSRSY